MIRSSNSLPIRHAVLLAALLLASPLLAGCERDPEADLAAGIEAYQERDFEAAYDYWAPHAQAGHLESQARLALLYSSGLGVEEDAARAVALFTPAAEADLPLGVYLRALHMMQGTGLPKDEVAAFALLQPLIACEMPAALNLGGYALNGNTALLENTAISKKWYMEAAHLGYAAAQYNLSRALLNEHRSTIDAAADGLVWAILSSDRGHIPASEFIDRLKRDGLPDFYFAVAQEKASEIARVVVDIDPYYCSA
jgi:TPR repeat protein